MLNKKTVRYFDMFAGVGGFRAGLERAGGFACIGHCEIDKYADAAYRAVHNIKESEVFYEDATKINTNTLPEFDLLCAGFPCQSFSIAGRRKGFSDPRGTMFFEITRVARARQPAYLLLENVPGLLSHDQGRTFAAILNELCELGYGIEWQVLNSKDFGVPQSRRRVYIVGYLDKKCAGKILPVRRANAKALVQLIGRRLDSRVYDPEGLAKTLLTKSGGPGGKTGLYYMGLSTDSPKITADSRCLTARYDRGGGKRKMESPGAISLGADSAHAVLTPDRKTVRQKGRRIKEAGEPMFTLTSQDRHGVLLVKNATKRGCIRKLVPRECFRLQGFTDKQIDRLLENSSDTQAYKQAGNAVTVNVVHALGLRIKSAHAAPAAPTGAKEEGMP
jgi:DNA (cytosine-5)-methyltransferase 1